MELTLDIAKKVLNTVDAGLVKGLGSPVPGQMCVEAAVCFAYGLPHSDNPPCVGYAVRSVKIGLNDSRWSSDKARTSGMRALSIAQLGSDAIDQVEFMKLVAEGLIRRVLPMALRAAASLALEPHKQALEEAAMKCEKDDNHAADAARYAAAAAARYAADAAAAAAARYAAAAARYAADAAAAARYAADAARYAADAAADAAAAAAAARYAADAARYAAADAADAAAAAAAAAAARDGVLMVMADVILQALIALKSPGVEYLYLLEQ